MPSWFPADARASKKEKVELRDWVGNPGDQSQLGELGSRCKAVKFGGAGRGKRNGRESYLRFMSSEGIKIFVE